MWYLDPASTFRSCRMCSLIKLRARPIPALGEFGVYAIAVDDIAAVPVEQHEYQPMRRGQRARLADDHHNMSATVDIPGAVEIFSVTGKRRRAALPRVAYRARADELRVLLGS
jgi:hypothetical protein